MESSQPGEHESDFCGLYALMLSHDTMRGERLMQNVPSLLSCWIFPSWWEWVKVCVVISFHVFTLYFL